ncbi:MAG: hypothetical protein ACRC4M_01245 [Mycoplasma sp.]
MTERTTFLQLKTNSVPSFKSEFIDKIIGDYASLNLKMDELTADMIWSLFEMSTEKFNSFFINYKEEACKRIIISKITKIIPTIMNRIRGLKLNNEEEWKQYENWSLKRSNISGFKKGYEGFNADGTYREDEQHSRSNENNPVVFINLFDNWFAKEIEEIDEIVVSILQVMY